MKSYQYDLLIKASALKRSAKGVMTSSDRRAPSKKLASSNKRAREMLLLNVLPSGVSRGPPMPVYSFRRLNYVHKLMKNS